MICPKCQLKQPEANLRCERCGLLFNEPAARKAKALGYRDQSVEEKPGFWDYFRAIFLRVDDQVEIVSFAGRCVAYAIIFIWGWKFILHSVEDNYVGESFMHLINLPFHEGGHIVFMFFGRFITVLGGSLMQCLIPLAVMFTFLLKQRDPFGAAVGLWWFAENLMDLAPYVADAKDLKLMLLGGVTGREVEDYHDWEYLLSKTDLLEHAHGLGNFSYGLGTALMILVFVWGGYLLYCQSRRLERLE